MRALVVTCAHRGDDARIVHRQIRSLLEAGHEVTIVSPHVDTTATDPIGLRRVVVPRAVGRRRVRSWQATRRVVRRLKDDHDLILAHDPELLMVLAGAIGGTTLVWDVHEDFVAAITDRAWIPQLLRPAARIMISRLERSAVSRHRVILAEHSYLERFPDAPVVPNSAWIADRVVPLDREHPRVVYVGRLSIGRGVHELIELGDRLGPRIELTLVGDADDNVAEALVAAHQSSRVRWLGPLPNPEALQYVDGAVAAVSLLHDQPNYVHSLPTKLVEYLGRGVPVITTPLPVAAALVESSAGGAIVNHGDVEQVVKIVVDWLEHPERRAQTGKAGRVFVRARHNWEIDGQRFVALLEQWVSGDVTECSERSDTP